MERVQTRHEGLAHERMCVWHHQVVIRTAHGQPIFGRESADRKELKQKRLQSSNHVTKKMF